MSKRNRGHRSGGRVSIYTAIVVIVIGVIGGLSQQGNPTARKITTIATSLVGSNSSHHDQSTSQSASAPKQSVATKALADQKYMGTQIVAVNHNKPTFTTAQLSTKKGAWATYGELDSLNRVTTANALLSKSTMPTAKREPLYVNPTGWKNKEYTVNGKSGYLYNRSHLIGYQLTGQNNNLKNLMTGTRSLNDPGMTAYENPVASYLKSHPNDYVRYQVQPVFRGNELVARGVHMQAQSVKNSGVSYNVYIFNIQAGVRINYSTGASQYGDPASSF
ncbi:DNA/RNA non-specific endonuclease [Levilactobacillus brevis]|uniref:DNA/RNA non-specific endonuclease n=1 Tax=Levilactobacillus brevis TaxID=1580 RepID=UPI001F40B2DC|nr:DNA/RNA non-specific endonuclease [Levilactobacillus brevis]MCE6013978.1 DNA/RNA non-specific endonuclease [Levilactobacillus brevis]MCE6016352.1 DNA/RNA non-specific endonuclease [Levilactobacillus brevis]MCE6018769.1 DNA/RNA non-specific endonuclease [Levilactobacillus brevis]MCE6021206.1 DNA/RNA non-specific endonuclease [Levilactobacillus brevis]MCE6023673.1 DNA/RNA non-specific endonuclease [Levilactobacillus brevis]